MRGIGRGRERQPVRIAVVLCGLIMPFCLTPQGADAADLALGEYLSAECVTCHQISGKSTGGIPSIVGLTEEWLVHALLEYKAGKRDNEVMRNIAARLGDEEIASLAAYFAAQGRK
jgi:cytochrome c553